MEGFPIWGCDCIVPGYNDNRIARVEVYPPLCQLSLEEILEISGHCRNTKNTRIDNHLLVVRPHESVSCAENIARETSLNVLRLVFTLGEPYLFWVILTLY